MSHPQSPKTPNQSPERLSVSSPIDDDDDVREEHDNSSRETADFNSDEDDYFKPLKRLRMMHIDKNLQVASAAAAPLHQPAAAAAAVLLPNAAAHRPLTSFTIRDILNHKPKRTPSEPARIVRPWDLGGDAERRRPRSADDDSRSESDCSESPSGGGRGGVGGGGGRTAHAGAANSSSPLDALFEMTSKAFEGLNGGENSSDSSRDHLHIFSNRQQPKKKRKSRTAFTNHQIFELEKRFLYQKYLSPADRDEIAQSLGLTNAQVITWFQNRRAKLKRDMEELKKDVDAAKIELLAMVTSFNY